MKRRHPLALWGGGGGGVGKGEAGASVQGSQSEAQWESAIHLPNITTLINTYYKNEMIVLQGVGRKKVTYVSLGATLSAWKSCDDTNATLGDRKPGKFYRPRTGWACMSDSQTSSSLTNVGDSRYGPEPSEVKTSKRSICSHSGCEPCTQLRWLLFLTAKSIL